MFYCKNCGQLYADENSAMCTRCGVTKGKGQNYCHNCGSPLYPDSIACQTCGFSAGNIYTPVNQSPTKSKSKVVAGLFGIFLGGFGIHNFYLGYTGKAVTQLCLTILGLLLSCIGIGVFIMFGIHIWGFVEGILILTGTIGTDKNGVPLD